MGGQRRGRAGLARGSAYGRGDPQLQGAGRPTDIAAGAGALWIGGWARRHASRVAGGSRYGRADAHGRLGGGEDDGANFDAGFPMIAVGADAVWAINPDSTVSRLDPASGRRVAVGAAHGNGASAIAAGDAGVWVISGLTRSRGSTRARTACARRSSSAATSCSGSRSAAGRVWASSERRACCGAWSPGSPDRAHDRRRRRRALRRVGTAPCGWPTGTTAPSRALTRQPGRGAGAQWGPRRRSRQAPARRG